MTEGLFGRLSGRGASSKTASAKNFEVAMSDEEWRRRLSPEQYRVLRQHGTERAGTSPLDKQYGAGIYHCAGCGQPLFDAGRQIRQRDRLAELLGAARGHGRDRHRPSFFNDPHRSALPPLRRASRACLRGRPEADRAALIA